MSGSSSGNLYVVATPLGNLGDITVRALDTLQRADVIACEDTRRTSKLLSYYEIKTRLISYHDHNERERANQLLEWVQSGQDVALVSNAGTPLISDPGHHLISRAHEIGIRVIPIPGPSAVSAALSVSPVPAERFTFLGFLPRQKKKRKLLLDQIALSDVAVVLYEAPGRLKPTLSELVGRVGPDREITVVREATKKHEEILHGKIGDIIERFDKKVRGEITIVIDRTGDTAGVEGEVPGPLAEEVALLESWGLDRQEAMRRVARGHGLPRRVVYRAVVADGENARE